MPSFLSRFLGKKTSAAEIKEDLTIPQHVAIIMDGNRRWADMKKLPRVAGYKIGLEALREIYKTSLELGIKYLTIYAFSTENRFRPKDEVKYLEWLIIEAINTEKETLKKLNVKIKFLGRIEEVNEDIVKKITEIESETASCTGLTLFVMYNYGGKAEIVDAARKLVERVKSDPAIMIDEEAFSKELYTGGAPDPDLLIRTGGDMRISNFLLWQLAYSELYMTETLFPDFRREQMVGALREYTKRSRRFGR